jgi:predicted nucleotidyltransferase
MQEDLSTLDLDAIRRYHREREQKRRAQREANRLGWLERTRAAIRQIAPQHPAIQRVYLFGSIVQTGRFRPDSDIDVAVECTDLAVESELWRALEHELDHDVDVRPWEEPIISAVKTYGEQVYEREDHHPL